MLAFTRCDLLKLRGEAMIRALPLEKLEALAEALLDFSGAADLTGWLQQRALTNWQG